jgi:hypothetical protein
MTGPFRDDLRFDLAGRGVQLELLTGGEAGLALTLERQGTRRTFAGDQIALHALGIGTLVTVELERAPESHRIDFSVLLPSVDLHTWHSSQDLRVVAVRTTHDDRQPDPEELPGGVSQSYEVVELRGTVTLLWSASKRNPGELCHLWVKGASVVPRPGVGFELRRAEQQGENPEERRLELTVREPPPGPTPEPSTAVVAEYRELACSDIKTVIILPETTNVPQGRSLAVEVEPPGIFTPRDEFSCGGWEVTQDQISPSDGFELIVDATCDRPVTLDRAQQQGPNPDHLWLRARSGDPAKGTGSRRPRYTERTQDPYAMVVILPEGPCLHLANPIRGKGDPSEGRKA